MVRRSEIPIVVDSKWEGEKGDGSASKPGSSRRCGAMCAVAPFRQLELNNAADGVV